MKKAPKKNNRALKWVRLIHSYSSMALLMSLLFFALTGLSLNHRDWLPEADQSDVKILELPEHIFSSGLNAHSPMTESELLRLWLTNEHDLKGRSIRMDWDEEEGLMILDVKRPGGYTIAEVDINERSVTLEQQEYGAFATLNDLHMGRNAGIYWSLFIDFSSIAMLLFSITGIWLVLPQKKRRTKLLGAAFFGLVVMYSLHLMTY